MSTTQEPSQTAQEYIADQLQLEEEAREVLPYQFDTCTNILGPLRQTLFSCLTCNPPPASPSDPYTAAGICYSCSISCHGEHELVELFTRRNFVCDCGTTRISSLTPCSLRTNADTGMKGNVRAELPAETNTYNQNFANRFCGCGRLYDAHSEKGTMFQCVGLGSVEQGGCGEDWWHAECIMGIDRDQEVKKERDLSKAGAPAAALPSIKEDGDESQEASGIAPTDLAEIQPGEEAVPDTDEPTVPPGFPDEDAFEHFICYKCTNAFPWIRRYAGSPGFLPGVPNGPDPLAAYNTHEALRAVLLHGNAVAEQQSASHAKRKADDDHDETTTDSEPLPKKLKSSSGPSDSNSSANATTSRPQTQPPANSAPTPPPCIYTTLPPAPLPTPSLSLFLTPDFRPHLCHCPKHFPLLTPHPLLLDDEESYEPPLSDTASSVAGGGSTNGGSTTGGSMLERGEAALSTMDRVRAIEGVMVYNHLRDKVKDFLKPFAESGRSVGAEDVKAYFERLREEGAEAMAEGLGGQEGAEGGGGGGKE